MPRTGSRLNCWTQIFNINGKLSNMSSMPDAKNNSYRQAQIQVHSLCKTVFTFSFAQPKAKLYISRNFSGQ